MMKQQRGYLLLIASVIIVIFALLSAALVRMYTSNSGSVINVQASSKAYSLANAGVEDNAYLLSQLSATCNGAYQSTISSFSTGEYHYKCSQTMGSTSLSSSIGSNDTSLDVASTAGFASAGAILVDAEVIYYNKIVGNSFQGLRRGQESSASSAHSSGALVTQFEYIITGEGGVPNLTSNAFANRQIDQAVNYNAYAAGSSGQFYHYRGGWTLNSDISNNNINGLSCISPNSCVAVGDRINSNRTPIYTYDGNSWSRSSYSLRGTDRNVNAISCVSVSGTIQCRAAGDNGRFYSYSSGAMALTDTVGSTNIYGISCVSSSQCRAAGNSGRFFTFTGGSWTNSDTVGSTTINSISCINNWGCVAVGASEKLYACSWPCSSSSAWSEIADFGGNTITSVVCLSSSNCKAVGGGSFYSCSSGSCLSGGSWASVSAPALSNTTAIACVSPTDCKAVGSNGQFFQYNGSTWILLQDVGGGGANLYTVATPSSPSITKITSNLSPL